MAIFLMFIGSALLGGFIGGLVGYIIMYNAWNTDQDNFFEKLDKKINGSSFTIKKAP